MNITKIVLAIAVTSVMVAVALAPIMLSQAALAARSTTCTNGGGQTKDCSSPAGKCQTTIAGTGNGGGENKGSTC